MKNLFLLIIQACFTIPFSMAQYSEQPSSAEIYEKLEKFNFLGTALYVAAHPDDENTRLISYLSNGINARTAYLSITRGDGGQNLIGTEIRELLGVLRSQELQMARQVDGGSQFFTRANDFGYSKHPDETLRIWNKEDVLEDMVYVIRSFKPDIIVNRFDHRSPGRTHGHHTSSAMLALEANKLASDPNAYAWQTKEYGTWDVKRHFFNTSWWFYGSREKFAEADKSRLAPIDVGVYYPTLGLSNNEISAFARSKHRSQGFGSSGDRGNYQEYLELLEGDMPPNKDELFSGINTSWSRIEGGDAIQIIMDRVMNEFDFRDPSGIVPDLLKVHDILENIKDEHWKPIKLAELHEIIVACTGMFVEASTDRQQYTLADSIEVEMEWTNRSLYEAKAVDVELNGVTLTMNKDLEAFTTIKDYHKIAVNEDIGFSNPYWLNEKGSLGMYKVNDARLRTMPESPPAIPAVFTIECEGRQLTITRPVNYRYVNPAAGEIREPLAILPPATVKFDKELYLLSSEKSMEINVRVRASRENLIGILTLELPASWSAKPDTVLIEIPNRGEERSFRFTVTAPDRISEGMASAIVNIDGTSYSKSLININYDHIPLQTILMPAETRLVKVPMTIAGHKIAYLMGAGDKVPESLQNVGYNITLLELEDIQSSDLSSYDAIIIGVRAYNTIPELSIYNKQLFDYAYNGGTLVTQYNTSRRLNFDMLAPYPIKLSRSRVTDEYAEVRILNPSHRVLNYPNKISEKDFDSWVQERGLYFPEEWDSQYEAILSCNDKGESPLDGSLLIAPYGKGYFVYTSLSWFRQLPAGVPGAFRLFANILALSDETLNKP